VLPFTWTADTPRAFARFSQDGAPLVAPIIQIILSRAPEASKAWANKVMSYLHPSPNPNTLHNRKPNPKPNPNPHLKPDPIPTPTPNPR